MNPDWNPIKTAPATWAYFEVCRSVLVNKETGEEPKRDFAMYVPTDPEPWKIKGGQPMTDDAFKSVYTHWRDATPLPVPIESGS